MANKDIESIFGEVQLQRGAVDIVHQAVVHLGNAGVITKSAARNRTNRKRFEQAGNRENNIQKSTDIETRLTVSRTTEHSSPVHAATCATRMPA